jgi:FG-GAP-like repeat/IPT/TIG domain
MNNYYKDKSLYIKILLPVLLLIISSLKLVAQPIISSISPQSAAAGTTITILGSQFNPVASSDIVYFGNVRAGVTAASTTSIQVTVPSGATYLPISVTDIDVQLTGFSSSRFLPVFPGGASSLTTIAQSTVISTNSGANTIFIKSADLDGDGKPDLIASYATGNIGLFRNTSTPGNLDNNSFATEVDIFSGNHCTIVGIADMNGDGKQDLITYNQDVSELTVWQNQSVSGTIAFIKAVTLPDTGPAICVGDIDGDGRPDIIQVDNLSPTLKLIKNNSTGGILDNTSFDPPVGFNSGNGIEFLDVQDLDGDGKPEIITCNRTDNTLSVFRNTSVAGIIDNSSLAASVDFPAGKGPFNLAIADIDADGKADLIVSNTDSNTISILKNGSSPGNINSASFSAPVSFISGSKPALIDVGDLDGDGKPDIAVSNYLSGTSSVFKNITATGVIDQNSFAAKSDFTSGQSPYGIVIGDLDGDGKPEISVANQGLNTITIYQTAVNSIAPVITRISPDSAQAGQTVTIVGFHFSGTVQVKFGDSVAKSFLATADTIITAIVGAGASGKIYVSTSLGEDSSVMFTFLQAPLLKSIFPLTAGKGDTIFIHGKFLSGTNAVSFGGVQAASFQVLSDTVLLVVVAGGSSGSIQVTNPYGTSSKAGFIFVQPPQISFFSPQSGGTGDTVYIHGKYLTTTKSVYLGGTLAAGYTVISDTLLLVRIGSGSTGRILLDNIGDTISVPGFVFEGFAQLSSFSPSSAKQGDTVIIRGTNLTGTTAVYFGNVPASAFSVISDSVVYAKVGAGASGFVKLTTSINTDSLSGFVFVVNLPHLNSFNPTAAHQGDTVTIHGINLTGTTGVYFGIIPAANFTVISDSIIYAKVGTGASGYVKVVTTLGKDSLNGFLFVINLPHLNSFSPTAARQGDTVTIKGINLTGTTGVYFGNIPAANFTVISDSIIYAKVGTGASGYVKVVTPLGKDSLSGFVFVINLPHLNSFNPIKADSSVTVSIKGINFTGTYAVDFSGIPAASFTVVSDTLITAVPGTGASGFVSVFTSIGSDSLAGFIYDSSSTQLLKIISFSPATGSKDSVITIQGKNLSKVTGVSFGGTDAASFQIQSDSVITAVLGLGSSGAVTIRSAAEGDSLDGFIYITAAILPHIKTFTPDSGRSGAVVKIAGSGFTNATVVSFGAIPAETFTVESDSLISATVGAGASGDVVVTTPAGSASDSGFRFIARIVDSNFAFLKIGGFDTLAHITVTWIVKNDKSIVSYSIERGKDSLFFNSLNSQPSKQQNGLVIYDYLDMQPYTGLNYYRIRMQDTSGNVFYSPVLAFSFVNKHILLYPNPATSYVMVVHPTSVYESVIRVLDQTGKTMRMVYVDPLVPETRLDISGIIPGTYTVSWTDGLTYIASQLYIQH